MALELRTVQDIADEVGISRQGVHKKIKLGYPTIGEGRGLRINRNDPEWAIWIEEKKHAEPKPAKRAPAKKRSKSTQTTESKRTRGKTKKGSTPEKLHPKEGNSTIVPGESVPPSNVMEIDFQNLGELSKISIDKLKSIEQTRQIQDKRLRERNEHIPRSLISRVLAKVYDVDINEHIQIAGKASSAIAAALGIEKSEDILKIEEILTPELYRTLEHRKRIMNDFLSEVGGELVESE